MFDLAGPKKMKCCQKICIVYSHSVKIIQIKINNGKNSQSKCTGFAKQTKKKSLFYHLRQKADMLCLQETHSDPTTIQEWEFEWGDNKCIWSHGTTATRGVAILVNPKFSLQIVYSFVDEEG